MKQMKKTALSLLLVLCLVMSLLVPALAADEQETQPNEGYDLFLEVLELYREKFYKDKTTEQILTDAIRQFLTDHPEQAKDLLNAMLSADDAYGRYLDAEGVNNAFHYKEYAGVGLTITLDGESVLISEVTAGGPAAIAGIEAGDYLLAIDGQTVSGLALTTISDLARGEEGSSVTYSIHRPSTGENLSFTMTREALSEQTITYELIPACNYEAAMITIKDFSGMLTYYEWITVKNELLDLGVKNVIFDVRNNPGGDLTIVLEILNFLIPGEGREILSIKGRGGQYDETYRTTDRALDYDNIFVLCNRNSASGAEIFAGVLKEYDLATVIGEKTYGKGVGQGYFELSDETMAAFTVFEVLLPGGVHYDGEGITPDLVVENPRKKLELPALGAFNHQNYHSAVLGAKNETVLALEQRLKFLGYMTQADETFDTATKLALETLQRNSGLTVTGTLDRETLEYITDYINHLKNITYEEDIQTDYAIDLMREKMGFKAA
ncbi:S41 family peptidase [Feifania hominis]|uniref:Peptidoglycan-binding protein n=1 Tax=Feifania hominis TaxID=2763660 RepID=A0A926DF20_9FIRM|nr:S41 family peptidase [Feifania hominis]MBC8536667.1 peptidoglycan-binding protein [Feifania hominis]